MKVKCLYNDPSNVGEGIPNDFDYGLEINKEYLVMGIMTFKKSDNLYFLIDEDSRPGWFPHQIFEIESNTAATSERDISQLTGSSLSKDNKARAYVSVESNGNTAY